MDNLQVIENTAFLHINNYGLTEYQDFLKIKTLPRYTISKNETGHVAVFPAEYLNRLGIEQKTEFQPLPLPLPDFLFDRQVVASKVIWKKKRYALFWDAGLGKTLVFLELARQCAELNQKSLIISPLNIISQTLETTDFYNGEYPAILNLHNKNNVAKYGPKDIQKFVADDDFNIAIINHMSFRNELDLTGIDNVILDESAILKNAHGTLRTNLINSCKDIERKSAYSATQAPNARVEYAQIAVWLEMVRSDTEFQGMFFVTKDNGWALRKHRVDGFYKFLSSFSMFMRRPEVYGFENNLNLKPYEEYQEEIPTTQEQVDLVNSILGNSALPGMPANPKTFRERQLYNQVSKGFAYLDGKKDIVYVGSNEPKAIRQFIENHSSEKAIIWTAYDEEEQILLGEFKKNSKLKVVLVTGKTPLQKRGEIIKDFRKGKYDVLISKPRLLGMGLNLHIASLCIFSSLQDSWQQFYQALKRLYRYPQEKVVKVYLPYTVYEKVILDNVLRKRDKAITDFAQQEQLYFESGFDEIKEYLETDILPKQKKDDKMHNPIITKEYEIYHGDSIEKTLQGFKENSIDLVVTSIPFRNDLFAYTDHVGDMGNSGGIGELGKHEFITHLSFCLTGILNALKPGRIACIEISQSPLRKGVDGVIGMSDFRGDVIRCAETAGFYQLGEWAVVGNPQMEAIVKHITTLSMNRLRDGRSNIAPMINDYIIVLKKPGETKTPINSKEFGNEEWIEAADGVAQHQQYNRDKTQLTSVKQKDRFNEGLEQWGSEYQKLVDFVTQSEEMIQSGKITREELVMSFTGAFPDINQGDTLNTPFTRGKTKSIENADKHVCPFSIPLVNRLVRLYSNPGEIVLDPFGGIGTTAKVAIELNRKAISIELKAEYFLQSCEIAEQTIKSMSLPKSLGLF